MIKEKEKKERERERGRGKKGTSRMFYFHLHDNESFREGRGSYSSGKSKVSDSKASQRVGIIKTTEGKCFRVGGRVSTCAPVNMQIRNKFSPLANTPA